MIKCPKCLMLKIDNKSKCACNVKKFNSDKLSKKTSGKKVYKEIPKISEKKKKATNKGKMSLLFQKIAKEKCKSNGDAVCEYCGSDFNINHDLINQTVAFAHILNRREFKPYELFKNNIAFVCSESCHKGLDAEICKLKIKPRLEKEISNLNKIEVGYLKKYI